MIAPLLICSGLLAFVVIAIALDLAAGGSYCEHCGLRMGSEHIPPEIRAMATKAGAPDPDWYVGRLQCPYYVPKVRLAEVVAQASASKEQQA